MARGELMKKLLASYGRDDEFRAVAEQIIVEEERTLSRDRGQRFSGAANMNRGASAVASRERRKRSSAW